MSLLDQIRGLGLDFDVVKCITVVEGYLVNESPLRVGRPGEELTSAIDLAVERLPDGRPYIPGSTLKGCIRSLAEQIARSSGYEVCNIFQHENRCTLISSALRLVTESVLERGEDVEINYVRNKLRSLERRVRDKEDLVELLSDLMSSQNIRELVNKINQMNIPCPVCRIFGNNELASHVTFYDALPKSSEVKADYRTRVAIDRFRRASRSGALFNYEYIPLGYEWNFKLHVRNISISKDETKQSKLLKILLIYLNIEGIHVGSMRSVGLGLVKLVDETKIIEYKVEDFMLKKVAQLEIRGGQIV